MEINITQAGLLLDIAGVLLLFKYGLPSKVIDNPEDGGNIVYGNDDKELIEKIEKENKKIRFRAYLGLTFILIGFILQFFGSAK